MAPVSTMRSRVIDRSRCSGLMSVTGIENELMAERYHVLRLPGNVHKR